MKNRKLLPSLSIMQQQLKGTLVLKGKREKRSGVRYNTEAVLHFGLRTGFTAHIHVATEYCQENTEAGIRIYHGKSSF